MTHALVPVVQPPENWSNADYYTILGVDRWATLAQIRQAFRRLSKVYHPDSGGDTEKFKTLNAAYETLANPQTRFEYDVLRLGLEQLRLVIQRLTDCLIILRQKQVTQTKLMRATLRNVAATARTREKRNLTEHTSSLTAVNAVLETVDVEGFVNALVRKQLEIEAVNLEKTIHKLQQSIEAWDRVDQFAQYLRLRDVEGVGSFAT